MKKLITLLVVLLLLLALTVTAIFAVIRYIDIPIEDFFGYAEEDGHDTDTENKQIHYEEAQKYHDLIEKYSQQYEVPITLVYAVIECESGFREDAKSRVGACGLMQLMPVTYSDIRKWLGLDYTDEQIMDPEVNIQCGTYYLSRMYRMFDDWELAVAAYNAGPGNVQKWLKNEDYTEDGKLVYIPFSETSAHVQKVVKAWEKYDKQMKG